jgi:3,4-dihydroxy-2-butanone 4-phosphate synthase
VLFHRLPRQGHPRHCVTLCGEAGVSPVTLCCLLLYG